MEFDNKIRHFIESMQEKDNIAIIYHADVDGLCSAAITGVFLEKLGRKISLFTPVYHAADVFVEIIKKLREKRISKIIMVDFAADKYGKDVKEMESFADIIILDHHEQTDDLNSGKTLFIKAHNYYKSEEYIPCSKFCFDAFMKIADITEMKEVMLIGFIADSQSKGWETIKKEYPEMKREKFMGVVKKINNGSMSMQYDICLKILTGEKSFDNIKKKTSKIQFPVEKEIEYYLKNWKKIAEVYPELKLAFIKLKSKYNISSTISTVIAYGKIDWVIVVYNTEGKSVKISARRQDKKIKMNELLKNAAHELKNATAGGHVPAAGASIMPQDLQKFKQNIIALLKGINL